MYNITFNTSEVGALDNSIFEQLSPTQSDIDALKDELQAQKELMDRRLEAIEDQVLLVRRDAILEKDYEELKEAWEAYNTLLERLKTFKRLKDSA